MCAAKCTHHSSATCASVCEGALEKLRAASESVSVGPPLEIKSPSGSIVKRLPKRDTSRQFDGMMFAGGVQIGGQDSFAARVCTNGCIDHTSAGLFSSVIFGELSKEKQGMTWKQATQVDVPHPPSGAFVGPEDPRLDVVDGSRFILANVNVDVKGCKEVEHAYEKPRQMFFAPVDAIPNSRACHIQLDGVSPCKVQKNWAPLVPRNSKEIYFVYSLSPLRVLKFDKQACKASFTEAESESKLHSFAGLEGVHGGTRFVHGITVPEGDIYFAFGHTKPPGYKQVITAVLMKRTQANRTTDPTFHLIGMSCPIKFPQLPAGRTDNPMMIATSIVNFDPSEDHARITFQAHDSQSFLSDVKGIGAWLQATYENFRMDGPVHCVQD